MKIKEHFKIYKERYILVSILISVIISCNNDSGKKKVIKTEIDYLTKNVGIKFDLENFIDTNGKSIKIDFTKSDITIIDFWIDECPPCNAEMRQFEDLIKGRDKQITIISISLSGFEFWKQLFTEKKSRYSFLTTSLPNWQHLNLKSSDDPKLKHQISEDRLNELTSKLDVTFFPAYFVINKDGIIKARPISAVEYIKEKL